MTSSEMKAVNIMKTSLYQEFYKFSHKKITWVAPMLLLGYMALWIAYPMTRLMTMMTYDSSDAINLIVIIVGSTMFSMEFQNNTILTLIYKSSSKPTVYFNKFITIFVYDVLLHALSLAFTVVIALTIRPVAWMKVYRYNQPLIINMLSTTGIDVLTSVLIISLVFVISTMINSNAVVITASMAVVFFGEAISTDFMNLDSSLAYLFKWNPFNMTLLTLQYSNYPLYHETTLLTNLQISLGALAYMLTFLGVGYLIFRKKRF